MPALLKVSLNQFTSNKMASRGEHPGPESCAFLQRLWQEEQTAARARPEPAPTVESQALRRVSYSRD